MYSLILNCHIPTKELKKLYDSILPEFKDNKFQRSSIRLVLNEKSNKLSFRIKADDASALLATTNAVLKLLKVYENMTQVVAHG